jgi:outer membrane receptor protein involved in Fe transport
MDDVFVADATLRYRRNLPERQITLEPYVVLRNLLDQRYAYVQGYPMPGFNVLAGLKIAL